MISVLPTIVPTNRAAASSQQSNSFLSLPILVSVIVISALLICLAFAFVIYSYGNVNSADGKLQEFDIQMNNFLSQDKAAQQGAMSDWQDGDGRYVYHSDDTFVQTNPLTLI